MPALQTSLSVLNRLFSHDEVRKTARLADLFAPGRDLDITFAIPKSSPLHKPIAAYFKSMPSSFKEMLRAVIYHALTTKRPTPITFAWAPGYDFELTMWDAPDTKATPGGLTVLVKSRYPGDRHPLAS